MIFEQYVDIDKDELPYALEMDLGGFYKLEFHYNAAFDFFSVDLFKNDEPLLLGEKLILNRPLFNNSVHIDIPYMLLVPMDRAGTATRITYDNFGDTVLLYYIDPQSIVGDSA